MTTDREYDDHGWIVLRDAMGCVRFHVHPSIMPMLEQQVRNKVAKMEVTMDENGKNVVSFGGIPIRNADQVKSS